MNQRLAVPGGRFASLLFVVSLLLAMPAILHAQPSGTGTITGRVSNAATNVNLEGAVVTLDGTS